MLTIFHVDSMSCAVYYTHSSLKPKEVNRGRGLNKKKSIDLERKRVYQ
jgi:hypothetical protein